ncbi:hypothetical protein PTQ19_01060 [Microbacterium esteraromaticum]|uniref:hypothetical protein n=1 Tax=Microbacterium esteraromaticum TaxID=57043 RepID=UPI00236842B7|nr:hypothetical protein [Microbacterium esteraromaticum]WDH79061.1 hypothetical protein PTQ19_01060 [Microbacterium esteraromaticum]
MLYDRVLDLADAEQMRSEIAALAAPRTLMVEGVSQGRLGIEQFRFWVSEPAAAWEMVRDNGARWSYVEGVVDYGGGEPRQLDFIASLPEQLKMLWPTELLLWGNRPTHFRPVLLQRIGQSSLLLTLEHGEDPAMRQTMVVDRFTGIATKRIEYDRGLILTSVVALGETPPNLDATFEPVTDWIRSEY